MSKRSREYYLANREKILAANERCRQRRSHLWKRKAQGPRYRRRTVCCAECGQSVYSRTAIFHPRQKKNRLYALCARCEQDLYETKALFEPLDRKELFLFDDCLTGARSAYDFTEELLDEVSAMVARLDTVQARVIHFRFFKHQTLEQVGKHIQKTRERVRQIQNSAMRKLRARFAEAMAFEFLSQSSRKPERPVIDDKFRNYVLRHQKHVLLLGEEYIDSIRRKLNQQRHDLGLTSENKCRICDYWLETEWCPRCLKKPWEWRVYTHERLEFIKTNPPRFWTGAPWSELPALLQKPLPRGTMLLQTLQRLGHQE